MRLQSYHRFVALFIGLISLFVSSPIYAQSSQEVPDGWEISYFNMGRNEYCTAVIENGNDALQIDLYKDAIDLSFTIGNGSPKSCKLTIGSVEIPCKANQYGELIITLSDKKTVDQFADAVAKYGVDAILTYNGKEVVFNLGNTTGKNIVKALQWVRNNPIGFNSLD